MQAGRGADHRERPQAAVSHESYSSRVLLAWALSSPTIRAADQGKNPHLLANAFHRSRLASSLRRRHSQVRGITSGVRLETSITPRKNIMELNFIQPLCGVPLAVSNENLSNSHNNDSSHWVEEGEESNKVVPLETSQNMEFGAPVCRHERQQAGSCMSLLSSFGSS
ncbi:uncharacterized protein DS421_6g182640 [Arachis hypogaea]|nr:uncharacterized protein DS421_6g182640 [Arachis hypogaea]